MTERRRDGDYHHARVGAAAALTGVLVTLLIVDAFQAGYDPSPIVLLVLASLIAGLLAVDLPDIIGRGRT